MKVYVLFRRYKWDGDEPPEYVGIFLHKETVQAAADYLKENVTNYYGELCWDYWGEEREMNTDEVYTPALPQ